MTKFDQNNRPGNVLVLDGNQFSTLSIVRSLGRKNISVTVACVAGSGSGIAACSRYVGHTVSYADPIAHPDDFVENIIEIVSKNSFDLVIPVTENTALPLAKQRATIEQYCLLALPDNGSLELAIDKNQTFQIAEKENVPVPGGITIDSLDELTALLKDMVYPVVIKPSKSVAETSAARTKLNVQYAFNEQELIEKCAGILRHTQAILQEYFRGDGVGVEVLARHGEIVLAFQHQRLHEFPLTGGGSTLRQSVAINPQLLEHSKRLIKRLNWHGVAMLEFKYNAASAQCRLMEINGRFWGSLPLAVAAGADFPYALYRLLVSDTVISDPPYQIGRLNRKMKDDLYWLLVVLFRRDSNPLIIWPSFSKILADCLSAFSPKHRFDSFAYDDPWPFLIDGYQTAIWAANMVTGFVTDRYLQNKFLQIKKNGKTADKLKQAQNILFVCYGNINRSVLAEKCFQFHCDSLSGLKVDSAGFHPVDQRPADPMMIQVAGENGIDLNGWASKKLSAAAVNDADLIFVMEIAHYQKLASLFPNSKNKVYLLGCMTADDTLCPLEIGDPYGHEKETYQECFRQISNAVQAMTGISAASVAQ
ncbi:MAG: ATP-grasp domain-containing protein [Methylococcales bacterium]|nr:ATP-grasp domain-containing protein [Methylococcales bacterium]